ncbi:hypothetical protein L202_00978 [Cryptococcus amylolentus CBS 6039]|uniref:Uncharacterized protein n=2 Tax=Cryptococcus amylolentus TaxID=104669 RepID=A0A1E3I2V9_9TREE|nr:hypothetical protein L202_00978 [Cryptococcus amylolentus CBS 6039]ODN82685.1 hypothetical protein L202_00978 [Cryptococcus amylolentus CBS 6039]ODO10377.1 hypothetical protein I350_00972 [Cryptococcus amylolentus CBS 6273]
MLFGDPLSLLLLAGYVSANSGWPRGWPHLRQGLVHAQGGDVLKPAPRHQLSARYPSPRGDSPREPEQGASNPEAWAGVVVHKATRNGQTNRLDQLQPPHQPQRHQQSLPQQQQLAQQQPPQPPQPQPLAHPLWQRVDLCLQIAVPVILLASAACLTVGLGLDWNHRTAPGHVLYDYAGPGIWIIGAFLSFPSLIAAWNRVPGAELAARGWIAVAMVALDLGVGNAVGNIVHYSSSPNSLLDLPDMPPLTEEEQHANMDDMIAAALRDSKRERERYEGEGVASSSTETPPSSYGEVFAQESSEDYQDGEESSDYTM